MQQNIENRTEQFLATNHGLRVNDDQNSLKAGERGSTFQLIPQFIRAIKQHRFWDREKPGKVPA